LDLATRRLGIALSGCLFFAGLVVYPIHLEDMLGTRLDCPLKGDERARRATPRFLVPIVDVTPLFHPQPETVQSVERPQASCDAQAPEKDVPGPHGDSPSEMHRLLPPSHWTTARMSVARVSGSLFAGGRQAATRGTSDSQTRPNKIVPNITWSTAVRRSE